MGWGGIQTSHLGLSYQHSLSLQKKAFEDPVDPVINYFWRNIFSVLRLHCHLSSCRAPGILSWHPHPSCASQVARASCHPQVVTSGRKPGAKFVWLIALLHLGLMATVLPLQITSPCILTAGGNRPQADRVSASICKGGRVREGTGH